MDAYTDAQMSMNESRGEMSVLDENDYVKVGQICGAMQMKIETLQAKLDMAFEVIELLKGLSVSESEEDSNDWDRAQELIAKLEGD